LKCVDKKEVEIGCMYVRRINKEVKEKKLKEVKEVKEEDQLDYTGTKKKTKMVNEWYTCVCGTCVLYLLVLRKASSHS
jgi:hypothetical protein